jgi:hypothetical protein
MRLPKRLHGGFELPLMTDCRAHPFGFSCWNCSASSCSMEWGVRQRQLADHGRSLRAISEQHGSEYEVIPLQFPISSGSPRGKLCSSRALGACSLARKCLDRHPDRRIQELKNRRTTYSSGICNITSLTSKQKDSIYGLASNFEM